MGFDWVRPMSSTGMHLLFFALIVATLFITIGLFYRLSAIVFFIGFTYVELLDVTAYLNHYYFISLVAFIMIWVPARLRLFGRCIAKTIKTQENGATMVYRYHSLPDGYSLYFCRSGQG
jgi:hypothetical protein